MNKKKRDFSKSRKDSRKDYKSKSFKTKDVDVSTIEAKNALGWYVVSDQQLNDVARFPYPYPVGLPYSRNGVLTSFTTPDQYDHAIAGIANMRLLPTIGNAKTAGDPVNVAANGQYTFIRHLNSGSRNYEANDLMIYNLAVDSMYYIVSWLCRAYGTIRLYQQANRYLPKELLETQYIDFDSLRDNVAQFRAGLNSRIRRIAALLVPNVMPIFQRHVWLFQNYFKEGDSDKDQIYLFTPDCFYQFAYDNAGAGMLKCIPTQKYANSNGLIPWTGLLQMLDDMLDPVFADEDFNIIAGDIYKAYNGNVMQLAELPDEYIVTPVFNEEVLLQFKNAKVHMTWKDSLTADHYYMNWFQVTQAGANKDHLEVETNWNALNILHAAPLNTFTPVDGTSLAPEQNMMIDVWNERSKSILLTSPHTDVTPGENMINTRLTVAFDVYHNTSGSGLAEVGISGMFFGTEWPISVDIVHRRIDKSTHVLSTTEYHLSRVMIASAMWATFTDLTTEWIPLISQFRYLPEMAILIGTDSSGVLKEAGISLLEVDNYTLLDANTIGRLHEAAIMGEYDIPRIAMFPTSR